MIYALRKLIAFVFLGGMFWFIYQDLGNLDKPWFMHALGLITVAFAFFWLLIPSLVVHFRIRRRLAHNREKYVAWREKLGGAAPAPHSGRNPRLDLKPGERVWFHEKGTLYATGDAATGGSSRRDRPSDVAFPGFRGRCRRFQRIHCYMTDEKLLFMGKDMALSVPMADIGDATATPGGIVFGTVRDGRAAKLAFTFQNPLIAADVLAHIRSGRKNEQL